MPTAAVGRPPDGMRHDRPDASRSVVDVVERIVMASNIPHETGLLLALRRIRDGRVFAQGSDLYTHKGRSFPRLLVPFVNELFEHGHARVEGPREGGSEQRVFITETGEELFAELEATTKLPAQAGSTSDERGSDSPSFDDPTPTPAGADGTPTPSAPVGSTRGRHPVMKASAPIVWLSVNLRSGGTVVVPSDRVLRRHGTVSDDWLMRFDEVVRLSPERPDVIFLQEAKWFNHEGDELLLLIERVLRRARLGKYRGFLTLSRRSHHHQVVFINTDRLLPTHHWHGGDPDEATGRYGWVEVLVDSEHERTLWLRSIHLDPRDGDGRLAEAKQINAAVPAGQRAMMAGDWNSITSRRAAAEGEPQRRFATMPPAIRYGKGIWPPTKPGGDTDPDTRALDYLLDAGWICKAIALNNTVPTVTPRYEEGGELIIDRCLIRGPLALHSMWVDTSRLPYSDHRALGGVVKIVDDSATR